MAWKKHCRQIVHLAVYLKSEATRKPSSSLSLNNGSIHLRLDRMADPPNPLPVPLSSLVQRYLDGESIQTLAAEHATCHRTIYKWLLKESGDEYHEIVTDALVARIADADKLLDSAPDMLQIARAREVAKFARMDFERRRPNLYGPKQELKTDNTIRVIIDDRSPLPVIPHIDMRQPIISVDSEVIDNQESEKE